MYCSSRVTELPAGNAECDSGCEASLFDDGDGAPPKAAMRDAPASELLPGADCAVCQAPSPNAPSSELPTMLEAAELEPRSTCGWPKAGPLPKAGAQPKAGPPPKAPASPTADLLPSALRTERSTGEGSGGNALEAARSAAGSRLCTSSRSSRGATAASVICDTMLCCRSHLGG